MNERQFKLNAAAKLDRDFDKLQRSAAKVARVLKSWSEPSELLLVPPLHSSLPNPIHLVPSEAVSFEKRVKLFCVKHSCGCPEIRKGILHAV
jgi:hypothetical protein